MPGIGPAPGFQLALFGAVVDRAFGHVPYHVGSSLTEKRGWRDVDVRLLLPDDEYHCLFEDEAMRRLWDMAWSALGKEMTGLPVDFQFDYVTRANAEHDGPRSALLIRDDQIAVVRHNGVLVHDTGVASSEGRER